MNSNFIIHKVKRPKRKVMLKGIKSVSCMDGEEKIKVNPACKLLFELNKLSKGVGRKEK